MNFHQPAKVTDELAQEWADLNNRAQRMKVPTLLLWSDHDHELPLETMGRGGLERLGSEDKKLEVIVASAG